MYFIQGKDKKMKITRRQIRRIIKEAVAASDQDKEAAFAIIYTSDYIQGYMERAYNCLLYTSPSPRDLSTSRMPSSA